MAPKMVPFWTQLLAPFPPWSVFFSTFSRTPPWTRLLGDLGPPLVAIWLHFGALGIHFGRFGHHFGPIWLPFGALWLQKATKMSTIGPRRPNQSKNGPPKTKKQSKTRYTGAKLSKTRPQKPNRSTKTNNKHTSMQTSTSRATRSLKMGRRNSRRDNNFGII